jgi:hypothetical protein
MVKLKISLDSGVLQELIRAMNKFGTGFLSKTADAMDISAEEIQSVWMDYAGGANNIPGLKPLKHPKGGYAKSIKIDDTKGRYEREIYSEAKAADWIENGTKEIDMKDTHTKGPRSRIVKNGPNKGKSYLIVPFQWGTTSSARNIVPAAVQRLMLSAGFKASRITGVKPKPEINYSGELVDRWSYDWGDRINGDDVSGTARQKNRINGLVRFERGESYNRRYGGYLTFRIIPSWGTKGWIKPATPAKNVTRHLSELMRDKTSARVESAVREDLGL